MKKLVINTFAGNTMNTLPLKLGEPLLCTAVSEIGGAKKMIQKMVKKWNGLWTKSRVVSLGLGQILSLLLTFTGFTSSQIARKGIDAPFSQCFLNYLLLLLLNGGIMLFHRREYRNGSWYYYVILTPLDLAANVYVIRAYQHTSLTSVMLLQCWTIPCVVFLTWLFFKATYGFQKLVGVAICVCGLMTIVFSDTHSAGDNNPHVGDPLTKNPHFGDMAIIYGATLYGVRNVCEDFLVTKVDRVELMAFLGVWGVSITHSFKDERNEELKFILSSPETIFLFIGFSLAMFLFYSGVPLLLKIGGSRILNLSLLTSNVWAALIQNFVYHEKVDLIYFLAFAVVTLGLIIYSWEDEIDPNNGEAAAIDEDAGLGLKKMLKLHFKKRETHCII